MTIRAAAFSDIPAIAGIMRRAYEKSIYAGVATFDEVQAKQLCARSLHRHGQHNYGATLCLVSENGSAVTGFIIGLVDLVYPTLAEYVVTDLMFLVEDSASPRDAPEMVRRLIAWAEENPKVIEIHLGVTDAIGTDWNRVGKLYERAGLEQCGGMFRRLIDRRAEARIAQ